MTKSYDFVSLHSCFACDYLGPARIEASVATCPDCQARTLVGTWIHYDCQECGFKGDAYTADVDATIPCRDCGLPLKLAS